MATARNIAAFEGQIHVTAGMDVGRMWDRYLGEFLAEYERLQRTQISVAEMEGALNAFIESLSDKPLEDVARQSASVAYNQGRSAEILSEEAVGRIDYVVRSEFLDANTCATCALLDGTVIEVDNEPGSPYWRLMPPAECLGGDRCRGFYVPIGSEAVS